jgi:integrase
MTNYELRHSLQDGHAILNKLPYLSTYMGHVGVESTQVYLTITEALLREGDMRFREKFEDIPKDTLRKVLRDDWIP